MHIDNPDAFFDWLVAELSPITDADPTALAKYVLALVRKPDKEHDELKTFANEQLNVFLTDHTGPFVDTVFDALTSKCYLPAEPGASSTPSASLEETRKEASGATAGKPSKPVDTQPSPATTSSTHKQVTAVTKTEAKPIRKRISPPPSENREKERGKSSRDKVDRRRSRSPRDRRGRQTTSRRATSSERDRHSRRRSRSRSSSGSRSPPYKRSGRRRCEDFEERGYCIRGDQCPYYHGRDPVVVDENALSTMVPLPSAPPNFSSTEEMIDYPEETLNSLNNVSGTPIWAVSNEETVSTSIASNEMHGGRSDYLSEQDHIFGENMDPNLDCRFHDDSYEYEEWNGQDNPEFQQPKQSSAVEKYQNASYVVDESAQMVRIAATGKYFSDPLLESVAAAHKKLQETARETEIMISKGNRCAPVLSNRASNGHSEPNSRKRRSRTEMEPSEQNPTFSNTPVRPKRIETRRIVNGKGEEEIIYVSKAKNGKYYQVEPPLLEKINCDIPNERRQPLPFRNPLSTRLRTSSSPLKPQIASDTVFESTQADYVSLDDVPSTSCQLFGREDMDSDMSYDEEENEERCTGGSRTNKSKAKTVTNRRKRSDVARIAKEKKVAFKAKDSFKTIPSDKLTSFIKCVKSHRNVWNEKVSVSSELVNSEWTAIEEACGFLREDRGWHAKRLWNSLSGQFRFLLSEVRELKMTTYEASIQFEHFDEMKFLEEQCPPIRFPQSQCKTHEIPKKSVEIGEEIEHVDRKIERVLQLYEAQLQIDQQKAQNPVFGSSDDIARLEIEKKALKDKVLMLEEEQRNLKADLSRFEAHGGLFSDIEETMRALKRKDQLSIKMAIIKAIQDHSDL